ncbi:unnamed protein product [Lepeophtheirus salmonis]|uniref:(salmon louse) hypothetical protein n=1 Tax=Lepeophtheirus salmonis TaxID=72036 RepID=A0A7R8CUN1_LEPSM|nr:unnamed protein product [Lepeophtheirus salmonis]CAF2938048.1 unnamed protein product [Lepeophtheirus salmonis]
MERTITSQDVLQRCKFIQQIDQLAFKLDEHIPLDIHVITVGSPFVLKNFGQIRYDYIATQPIAASDKAKYGLDKIKDVRPEDFYEKEVLESGSSTDYQMFRTDHLKGQKSISIRKNHFRRMSSMQRILRLRAAPLRILKRSKSMKQVNVDDLETRAKLGSIQMDFIQKAEK